MEEKLVQIIIKLENGDEFVYGGEKSIQDLLQFMRWETPTNILCEDADGNKHLFHSSNIAHIYEVKF